MQTVDVRGAAQLLERWKPRLVLSSLRASAVVLLYLMHSDWVRTECKSLDLE
jgi:hypothetical protein